MKNRIYNKIHIYKGAMLKALEKHNSCKISEAEYNNINQVLSSAVNDLYSDYNTLIAELSEYYNDADKADTAYYQIMDLLDNKPDLLKTRSIKSLIRYNAESQLLFRSLEQERKKISPRSRG